MPRTSQPKTARQVRTGRVKPRRDPKHPVIDNRKPISTEEVARILKVPPARVRYLKELAAKILSNQDVDQ